MPNQAKNFKDQLARNLEYFNKISEKLKDYNFHMYDWGNFH